MKIKNYLPIFLFCMILLNSCTQPTSQSRDEEAKIAVREYLQKKGVTDYTEENWGKLDSVFSSYNLDMSYDYAKLLIERDISHHELTISQLKFNPQKNKARIKVLRDSVSLLRDSIVNIRDTYYNRLKEGKKNRLGISLKLKYKTLANQEKTRTFTFVFNSNDEVLSVGHHLDELGYVCD